MRHADSMRSDVNPYRLRAGTHQDNIADRQRDGTTTRGERNGRARLTEADVRCIRAELERGVSKSELARRFGVDHKSIRNIAWRRTWRHV